MQFVFCDGYAERELELRLGHPDACVADLASALHAPGPGLCIDGRAVSGDLPLSQSGLVAGATVEDTTWPDETTSPRAVAVLRVVGGLSAGNSFPLPAGRAVLGRGDRADIRIDSSEVSREHCLLEATSAGTVMLTDLGSRNGTDVNGSRVTGPVPVRPDDLIALGGAVLVQVLPVMSLPARVVMDPIREARPGGRLPFSRAPRPGAVAPEPPLRAPGAPPRANRPTFSISAIVSPLIMAAVMVAVTRQVMYAAISGLSPIMVIVNFVEERTRGKRSVRRGVRAFHDDLEQFRRKLRARHAAEVAARRAAVPDLAEMCFRAEGPARTLWERRPGGAGFLQVSAGFATLPWQVPVAADDPSPEVEQEITAAASLRDVPGVIDLSGAVAGIEGDRDAALAVARSLLCQAVTGSGPADLTVAVFTDADRARSWDWVKWLPHLADRRGGSGMLIATGAAEAEALARSLLSAAPAGAADPAGPPAAAGQPGRDGPVLLAVVDGAALLEGRPCALRDLLSGRRGPASGIVLTSRLPAVCATTLSVRPDGMTELRRLTAAESVPGVLATGASEAQARRLARRLARFEDPELTVAGAGLPESLTLLPLLGLPEVTGQAVLRRWRDGTASLRAGAVLGVSEQGVFGIDLDDDGPHGLIAGTTGSGKSELLRTLIISLAAGNDSEHLTFALIDYKGGGALDECARLPHSVGLVTDLDEQLSERALRCLEAELRHREHLLRDAGLSHVTDYQRLRDQGGRRDDLEPMPRLAVVIDEFATLVKALPHFVDSLVNIAQRGRSLGIHLIMATQRPAGSVNDAIKNNVKLRIALRLESSGDSMDVIDNPAAAAIGGRQRGRAFYRVSAKEVLPVQTALSTGRSAVAQARAPVTVAAFRFQATSEAGEGQAADGPTDLERLVAAAHDAAAAGGFRPPRRPWPDPLPAEVPLQALAGQAARGFQTEAAGLPALAVADDPDRQAQYLAGWDPAAGNLLLYGVSGYGTTSALATLALAVASATPADALHLYVMDLGAGKLAPLAGLPHAGAYIGPAERERQARLIRLLRRELDMRKASGAGSRSADWLVLIDNFASFIAEFGKDATGMQLLDDLERVYAEGPTVGVRFAVAADRSGAVPGPWAALTQQKLLLRLADPGDYGMFDVPRGAVPSPVPGRAVVAATSQVIQLAWPGEDLAGAVAAVSSRWPGGCRVAPAVGVLPPQIRVSDLGAVPRLSGDPVWIPVGLGDATLSVAGLELYEYEHALIAGPPRSGRSSALCAIAQLLAALPDRPAVLALTPRRSPLRGSPHVDQAVTNCGELEAAAAEHASRRLVILADDAESADDPGDVLEGLMKGSPQVTVIAAGRCDALRRGFGHWTQTVRESRCGVLLVPDYDLDGDLLGVTLPRLNRLAPLPGRGFLAIGGSCDGIQLALPDELT